MVIVGGCYGAAQTAAAARQNGYSGRIRIVSEEGCAPYQRPPLSKSFLTAAVAESSLPIRSAAFYRDESIELELGVRVERVDRTGKAVVATNGARIPYERLALATGARPRVLAVPGASLDGVVLLRSLSDARALKERLARAQSVTVVGGGFIGLEVASSCVALGKQVALVEMQDRLMARALPPLLSAHFAELHRRHGVVLHLAARISAIQGNGGRVCGVSLADGRKIPADLVVSGIGVVPNAELALSCGLACSDGIQVDRFGRSSDPDICAAGDCTRHPSPYADAPLRLESVQNAMDQAKTAGATLAGRQTPHDAVPWFWSDQYDVKLQMAGLSSGHDCHSVRGSMEEGRFSVYYLRAGRLIAADSVGRPADHMLARKLIAARALLTPEQARDASFDLKSLLAA